MGEDLIGTWDLDITSDRGPYKQRLRINPDLSGLYGTFAIEQVKLEDDKVSFKIEWEFQGQTFEMNFEGKLADGKLTGQLTSQMGTQEVKGSKVVRSFRGRPASPSSTPAPAPAPQND